MRSLTRLLSAMLVLLASAPSPTRAQIRASELAVTRQTIDGTVITLEYSRPRVRGRPVMFGERGRSIVHWEEVWTPGANYATTLETNKPITLAGRAIPAGKYSLWLIPRAQGAWTMVFDPKWRAFHTEMPDSLPTQIRFAVTPVGGAVEDALTFAFVGLSVSGATLELRWGTTRIAMPITVTPSLRMTTPVTEAEQFAGRYEWRFVEGDTTRYLMTLGPSQGYLMGTLRPVTWPGDFAMVRVHPTRDWYSFALFEKGEIYEVETTWVAEFSRSADGRVTGFVVRNDTDKIDVRATRLP